MASPNVSFIQRFHVYQNITNFLVASIIIIILSPLQASEKMSQDQQKKVQEEDDNYTEICNNVHGDMLSENPEVAQSAFGSHRVVPDRWKGMSPQQVQDVLETQERQKLERKVVLSFVQHLSSKEDKIDRWPAKL